MTTFDDRENAFEAKFAHDGEMQFKAEARRNKLLGLWAAGLMGKPAGEAAARETAMPGGDPVRGAAFPTQQERRGQE